MEIGLLIFPIDNGIQPVELGREAEARGFKSIWLPEHSHIPVCRRTQWGGRVGRSTDHDRRDPSTLRLGAFGAKPDAAHLDDLRDVGASFGALGLPPMDRDAAIATMEKYAPLVAEFNN